MRASDISEIIKLSTPEKIPLLEDLWNPIALDESAVPVPQSHREELDRRLKRNFGQESRKGNDTVVETLRKGRGKRR